MLTIRINGQQRSAPEDASLEDVLSEYGVAPSGVAVAVDGDVVPREQWSRTRVRDGMLVEVVTAVQGG